MRQGQKTVQPEMSQGTDGSKDSQGSASADTACPLQCSSDVCFSTLGRPRSVLKGRSCMGRSGHCRHGWWGQQRSGCVVSWYDMVQIRFRPEPWLAKKRSCQWAKVPEESIDRPSGQWVRVPCTQKAVTALQSESQRPISGLIVNEFCFFFFYGRLKCLLLFTLVYTVFQSVLF